jgi:S-adenosylmethionine:diacylglycerol 3-amino-3-carboxypropyl transferase
MNDFRPVPETPALKTNREELAARLMEVADVTDIANRHVAMDRLVVECLRAMGFTEGCDIFDAADMWYD